MGATWNISQQEVSILEDEHVLLSVRRDGLVEWKLPRIFSTFCVVDVTYYPFDTQKCVIEVSSWVYTIQELALLPAKSSANYEDIRSVLRSLARKSYCIDFLIAILYTEWISTKLMSLHFDLTDRMESGCWFHPLFLQRNCMRLEKMALLKFTHN